MPSFRAPAALAVLPLAGSILAGSSFIALILAASILAGCTPRAAIPVPPATAPMRERLAALALSQTELGSASLIPVRFVQSRVTGPFLDEGRTLYCVSTRMRGRTFGKAERAKIVIQEKAGILAVIDQHPEACDYHRTEPFPELETMAAGRP